MDLYKLGSPNEYEGQSIFHLIQIQEEPNPSPNEVSCVRPKSQPCFGLIFS
jgi:hypothetical protein